MKMNTNDARRRRKTAQMTTIVLLNLSNDVKCLFSQMMSVGSDASSKSRSYPNIVLRFSNLKSADTVSE
jgi:hypothetical protein